MRVVFMGTPTLAATILEALARRHDVVGVFTRPDAVRGRGKGLAPSPVKQRACDLGIDVFEAASLKGEGTAAALAALTPDVVCVAAFGAILPAQILGLPPFGCLNVHTSLLPRWRGAAPIERAVLAGDKVTGVCIMRMEEGLDTGPYCIRKEAPVDGKYVSELSSELAALGSEALLEALDAVGRGQALWTEQASEGVTYASKIGRGELDWGASECASDLVAKVRASSASHPSRTRIAGRLLAVECASVYDGSDVAHLGAGEVSLVGKRLLVGTSRGVVELERVRPAGKRSMDGRAFASGIQGMKSARIAWESV